MATEVENFIVELSREMHIEANGLFGNELELIALVRNCQFLYDKSRPDFKDNEMKEAAWQAIAKVMQAPVNDCKYRWRSLRDQYNKLKKDSQERCVSWDYYDDMKFIDPYIIPRRISLFTKSKGDDGEIGFKEEWLEDTEQYNIDLKGKLFKLIECVKAHPILYNKDLLDYKDKKKKMALWLEIAQTVGAPASDCEARWKTLRERFGRERKQKKENNEKAWKYYESLSFLDKHIKERRVYRPSASYRKIIPKPEIITNAEDTVIPAIIDGDVTLDNIEFIDATFEDEEEVEGCVPICITPNSETNQSSFNTIDKNELKRIDYRSSSSMHSQDEDDLFGQTIAAELRRISSTRKKMKIKADMFKLLYEAESDCD